MKDLTVDLPGAAAGQQEHPTSFAQQRMWFLQEWEPDSPTYNVPFVIRMRGPLDIAVLLRALQEIVDRHETLRTTYPARNGLPVQSIAASSSLTVDVVDLRDLPPEEREVRAGELEAEDARRPVDLAAGPVLRASLQVLA